MPHELQLPSTFSSIERAKARHLLEIASNLTGRYLGPWKADWLLSDLTDHVWKLRRDKSLSDTHNDDLSRGLDWRKYLADGSLLTDEKNRNLLLTLQKLAFLARQTPLIGISSRASHITWCQDLITIAQWLHRSTRNSNRTAALILSVEFHIAKEFISSFSVRGKAHALGAIQDCFLFLRTVSNPNPLPFPIFGDDIFRLPADEIEFICNWLGEAGCYTLNRNRHRYIDRTKLSRLLKIDATLMAGSAFSSFLRQFEPDLERLAPGLLVAGLRETEYFGHKTLTREEAYQRRAPLSRCRGFKEILTSLPKLAGALGHTRSDFSEDDQRRLSAYVERNTRPDSSTAWIPLETMLAYLNGSPPAFNGVQK